MEKLYIKPADMPEEEYRKNPKAFLTALYTKKEGQYSVSFPATYTTRNFHVAKKQCSPGKARSFGDLLAILNTYFTDVTPQTLLRIIYSIIGIEQKGSMLIYCPDVEKIVFHHSSWDRTALTGDGSGYRVLVDYLFYDYSSYVARNSELTYQDEHDFTTLMGYIGIDEKRCLRILRYSQTKWTEKVEDFDPDNDEFYNEW